MTSLEDKQSSLGNLLLRRLGAPVASPSEWIGKLPKWRLGTEGFQLVTPVQMLVSGLLGAAAGVGIISVINIAAELESLDHYLIRLPILFLLLVLIYTASQSLLLNSCAASVERALEEHRLATTKKLTQLSLIDLERLNRHDIQAGLTQCYEIIDTNMVTLVAGARGLVLAILLIGYLATISWAASLVSIVASIVCIYVYVESWDKLCGAKSRTARAEADLIGNINEILDGFKELKLSKAKHRFIFEDVSGSINRASKDRVISSSALIDIILFSNVIGYLLAGSIIFILPIISENGYGDISRVMALVLFLIGPIASTADAAQQLASVRFSIRQLDHFDNLLGQWPTVSGTSIELPTVERLEIRDICFSRSASVDDPEFVVGPISASFLRGQITFIEGGNGSGKTTLVRLITGLYSASSGQLLVNEVDVTNDHLPSYRQLFGVVFSDNHVFRKPYGLGSEQIEMLKENIRLLGIDHCCSKDLELDLGPDRLSTGQKKRLALALLLVEDRPIMIFDEWAADQDPQFREIFYRQLLPQLKSRGKIIIAITHDDRYFDLADQRYHMEDGKMNLVNYNG